MEKPKIGGPGPYFSRLCVLATKTKGLQKNGSRPAGLPEVKERASFGERECVRAVEAPRIALKFVRVKVRAPREPLFFYYLRPRPREQSATSKPRPCSSPSYNKGCGRPETEAHAKCLTTCRTAGRMLCNPVTLWYWLHKISLFLVYSSLLPSFSAVGRLFCSLFARLGQAQMGVRRSQNQLHEPRYAV